VRQIVFRRRWGTALWHWVPTCSTWPSPLEAEEREDMPKAGQFCNECRVRDPSLLAQKTTDY